MSSSQVHNVDRKEWSENQDVWFRYCPVDLDICIVLLKNLKIYESHAIVLKFISRQWNGKMQSDISFSATFLSEKWSFDIWITFLDVRQCHRVKKCYTIVLKWCWHFLPLVIWISKLLPQLAESESLSNTYIYSSVDAWTTHMIGKINRTWEVAFKDKKLVIIKLLIMCIYIEYWEMKLALNGQFIPNRLFLCKDELSLQRRLSQVKP